MSDRATRLVGLYSMIGAAVAVVVSPLLAMSYFATSEGAKYLEGPVAAWAEPGRDFAGGLLTWASPDRVYATYTQVLALFVPAMLLCALAVRAHRRAQPSRTERWGWRLALFGYALASVALVLASLALIDGDASGGATNVVFLALLVPGMLITLIGSTVLGIALLRTPFSPKLTSWLLTLAIPGMVLGSVVLGHNSLGFAPLMIAWGVAGYRLWRAGESVVNTGVATAQAR